MNHTATLNSFFTKDIPFLEATEPHLILIGYAQFEQLPAENVNKVLRDHYPAGLKLTMRPVEKFKKFFEISFENDVARVTALNMKLIIQVKRLWLASPQAPTLILSAFVLLI